MAAKPQKHTKGPWEAEYGTDGYYYVTYAHGLELRDNTDANAKLISAAPDLLKALQAYHAHFGPLEDNIMLNADCRKCAKLARAAISKATGAP